MCYNPTLIRNRKYLPNKKNGGILPPNFYEKDFDRRVLLVPVGCGECIQCRKQEKAKWQLRLSEEVRDHQNGKFITLTFSNKSIEALAKECKNKIGYELDNAIAIMAMKRFRERWRKKFKKAPHRWFITELGHQGTEHLHMHGIMWTDESVETIESVWQYGWIWPNKRENSKTYVNLQTVNYLIKYVHKMDFDHPGYKPRILTSPGIGKGYTKRLAAKMNKFRGIATKEYYRTSSGHKVALPVYWRNKIYSEEERELLWLNRLDKMERWVNGHKIDISQGMDEYWEALEYARELSTRLGYGNGSSTWQQKEYENELRQLKINERIGKEEEEAKAKLESYRWENAVWGEEWK